jgi:hypothetical protein
MLLPPSLANVIPSTQFEFQTPFFPAHQSPSSPNLNIQPQLHLP